MQRIHIFLICTALAATALAGAGETKLEGRLAPQAGQSDEAAGKAKFESKEGRMRLSVEAQDTSNAAAGNSVRIVIGSFSATVAFDPIQRNFDLNLDTGNGDSVPSLSAGDSVDVYDAATGRLLLRGSLGAK